MRIFSHKLFMSGILSQRKANQYTAEDPVGVRPGDAGPHPLPLLWLTALSLSKVNHIQCWVLRSRLFNTTHTNHKGTHGFLFTQVRLSGERRENKQVPKCLERVEKRDLLGIFMAFGEWGQGECYVHGQVLA
jgi:hypothetical protein